LLVQRRGERGGIGIRLPERAVSAAATRYDPGRPRGQLVTTASPTPEPATDASVLVVDDEAVLAPYLAGWDALAVACGQPFCAPAWMLAWWREARAGDARLRVALVFDGASGPDGEQGTLLGVGPFFAQVGRLGLTELRLLGAGFCHRIGPLACPGDEPRVARALAPALAALDPRPASVVFEGIGVGDRWPELLAAAWPARRPRLREDAVMEAPVIELGGSYESWMERRARKFRKEARRNARRLDEDGVTRRIAADGPAIAALLRLHYARWEERGGSDVGATAERVVAAAARELPPGRLEIVLLEGPDGPVSAELLLHAGETAAFWAGGFDPVWSKHAPGTQTMLVALESAAERGVQLADLGGGEHEYKRRMADDDRPIAWRTLFPRGGRYPLIRLRLAPKHVRQALRRAAGRLPERRQEQLKRLLRR
jgi:CelD/BcsL family acetyltransferase involved in cellulose biosynthesis